MSGLRPPQTNLTLFTGDLETVPTVTQNSTTAAVMPSRWGASALGLIVIAGVFGNVLLCLAVMTERRLQNMTNYFLSSLAVADLLVAVTVLPIAVLIEIYDGYFPLGARVCLIWATTDVLMCSASIWHMATLSVDRYCSLRFPLRYRRTRARIFVVAKIAFVWFVSAAICSSLAVAGLVNPSNVYREGQCAPFVPEFVIYGSVLAFYVPLAVMMVAYTLTVWTLSRNDRTLMKIQLREVRRYHRATAGQKPAGRGPAKTPPGTPDTGANIPNRKKYRERNQPSTSDSTPAAASSMKDGSTIEPRVPASRQALRLADLQDLVTESVEDDQSDTRLDNDYNSKVLYTARSVPELTLTADCVTAENRSTGDIHTDMGLLDARSSQNSGNNTFNDVDDTSYDEYDDEEGRSLRQRSCSSQASMTAVPVKVVRSTDIEGYFCTVSGHTLGDDLMTGRHDTTSRQDNLSCRTNSQSGSYRQVTPEDAIPSHNDADDLSSRQYSPSEMTTEDQSSRPVRTPPSTKVHRKRCSPAGRRRKVVTSPRRHSMPGYTKRKANIALGLMFTVFVVLWTPFFALNILSGICPACAASVSPTVWTVIVWLGWVSSLANPVIYTMFNPAFRAAFVRLLTCRGRRGVTSARRRQQQWTSFIRRHQHQHRRQP